MVNVLNVKPVVTLTTEGEISIISKNRGINKSANWIVEQIAGKKLDSVCKPAALYSYSDQYVREFAAKCREVGIEIPENRFYNIGPTIGTHVGTGAFGIAYIEE